MEAILEKLRVYKSPTPSRWREEAEFRLKNKEWLRYSQKIALKMLNKMDQENITQKQLAERMNCTQQYVSRILKGGENLSIETMLKIEKSLQIGIFDMFSL